MILSTFLGGTAVTAVVTTDPPSIQAAEAVKQPSFAQAKEYVIKTMDFSMFHDSQEISSDAELESPEVSAPADTAEVVEVIEPESTASVSSPDETPAEPAQVQPSVSEPTVIEAPAQPEQAPVVIKPEVSDTGSGAAEAPADVTSEELPANEPPVIDTSCKSCGKTDHADPDYCTTKSIEKGAVGRWSIPRVGVNVAIYASDSQAVTDAKDSANYIDFGNHHLLADHKHQGFNAIKSCKVGDKAYIDRGTSIQEYVCTNVLQGYNTGYGLTDLDNNELYDEDVGGIACYTCNNHWTSVTIVLFEPVSR